MAISNTLNSFLTPDIFSKEAAVALSHELVMKNLVSTSLSKEFGTIGDTINVKDFHTFKIRKNHYKYGGAGGETINKLNESSIPVTIEYQDGLDLEYTQKEAALEMNISEFHNTYIKPAASTLAEYMDRTILNKIQESDFNVATVSDYINNPDVYNNKLKVIPKINAATGVATNIGIPAAGSNYLFSTNMSTLLTNEIAGALATQQPAKLVERGYVTTLGGGTHIYKTPSLLKDYKVYKAKETTTQLTDDATKYIVNILQGDGDIAVASSLDKTTLTIKLKAKDAPSKPAAYADKESPTAAELAAHRAYDNYQRELKAIDEYVDHKIYVEGLTYGHLFYPDKDTGVVLCGYLKKEGKKYSLEFDLTRPRRRTQPHEARNASNPKGWTKEAASYDVYYEGKRIVNKGALEADNKGITSGQILRISPISHPITVSRDVCYLIHKESTKLVFAPPAPLDEKSKMLNTGEFAFTITQWINYEEKRKNISLDVMWGIKVIRPELIIKIIL